MKILDVFGLKPKPGHKYQETPAHKRAVAQNFTKKVSSPVILFFTAISLTSIVGARFYSQPKLAPGTTSPSTVVAPKDGKFEDTLTTETEREIAKKGVVVLKQDPQITIKIKSELSQFIQTIEELKLIINLPLADSQLVSTGTQQYLIGCSSQEWQEIKKQLETGKNISSNNQNLNKAIKELKNYQNKTNQLKVLLEKFGENRQKYQQLVKNILSQENQLIVAPESINLLAQLNQESWVETKEGVLNAAEMILSQGIPKGIPENIIKETVVKQLNQKVPKETESLAKEILSKVLEPNLIEDREETQNRAIQAALKVNPVFVEIKAGELIVEAGETISQKQFVLLDNFGLSRREINVQGLGISAILVTGAIIIFCLTARSLKFKLRRRDYILLSLLSLSAPVLTVFGNTYSNLPAIAILVSSFYNPTLAVTQVTLTGGLVLFANEVNQWEYLIASWLASVIAASKAGKMRSREELAFLGMQIGLIQSGTYLILSLISTAATGTLWYLLLPAAAFNGLIGAAWSAVALGISPLLERFFDIITPTRLAELSNPNCPLLQRLATDAPGTFQHTLFVACLGEAAGRKLGCNVELIRAGTLYHDIGKLHDPQGFIENQMNGPNKHDQINDPWVSAAIIKKHVSEGIAMAHQYGLPKVICDFIPQHQGTLVISYFYFQAKQTDKPVDESDFSYDGPIPQSREAGIMMLADGCEAALRSLKDASPEVALSVVSKILKARWQEGQLKDSCLEYYELAQIAEIFVQVWQQYNHKRIAYPKGALEVRCFQPLPCSDNETKPG